MTGAKKADIYFGDMVILAPNGDVYVYGMNTQNCIGGALTTGAPRKLRSGVLDVAAGYGFTAYLLEDGTILVQGDNSYGQAGNGTAGGSVNMGEVDF
jgi:alpha-tubulin suppressor-like RCC1 family protein